MNLLNNQMPKNLTMNIFSFMVNTCVGILLVPYLISKIGLAAYGFIPLAMTFTDYMNIINVSINGAITRYITIDIQANDWNAANNTFNTALWGVLGLIIIQIPIFWSIVYWIESILEVPKELLNDIRLLFGFIFCSYVLSLISSIFNTSMYANNRLDLSRLVDIIRITVRVLFIVFFFTFFEPKLVYIGISTVIASINELFFSYIKWRKLTPHLKVSIKLFDKLRFMSLFSMGGWLIINQLGYLLFLKIDLLLVNRLIGPDAVGKFSAIQQWNSLLRTFGAVLGGILGPVILISYSKNNLQDVIKYSQNGVKYLSLFIGLITGLICGYGYEILFIWLGRDFVVYTDLLLWMIIPLVINIGVIPLFSLNNAMNKVKIPGIFTLILGMSNFFVAYFFVKTLGYGIIGLAIASAIVMTFKNFIFTPLYASYILNISYKTFYKPLIIGCLIFLQTFLISHVIKSLFFSANLFVFYVNITLAGLINILFGFSLFSTINERKIIKLYINRLFNK